MDDIAASLNRMGMPTGHGKTWTAHRVGSVGRVNGIHGYLSAEKDGEWLTLRDAATRLGVSSHQVRKLIKAGILASGQIMPRIRSGPLTSIASMSPSRWREKAARVGSFPNNRSQCFQTLEKEVHNQLDDGYPVSQRTGAPILRDMAEEAVLDLIPLRCARRIVANMDR